MDKICPPVPLTLKSNRAVVNVRFMLLLAVLLVVDCCDVNNEHYG